MTTWVKSRSRLLAVLACLAITFIVGVLVGPSLIPRTSAQEDHEEHAAPAPAEDVHEGEEAVELNPESREGAGIRVVTVGAGTVSESVMAPGVVRANQNHAASVIPTTPGVLTAVRANLGQQVRKGQVLATLRSTELAQAQAELERSRRELSLAQDLHARTEELAKAGAFSQPPTEEAEQAASEAAQAVDEAQAEIDDNTERVRLAERKLKRAQDSIGLGSIGQESIEDAQRDDDEAAEAQKATQAELTRARSELVRQQGLLEKGLSTQQAVEQAQTDAATAEAASAKAQSDVRIAGARLARARELVAQDIPTSAETDAAQEELVEHQQALRAAQARLREAARRREIADQRQQREQTVYDQDLLAKQELTRTEGEVRRTETAVTAAEDTIRILSQGTAGDGGAVSIVAPVSGTVVQRDARLGQVVDTSSVLFEIANIRSVFVEASLYEQDVAAVRLGQSMTISVQAHPDTEFAGTVSSIDPMLDTDARKVIVRALVDNPGGRLMPGMFAEVRLYVTSTQADLTVPVTALETDHDEEYVFVEAEPNHFEKHAVAVGRRGPSHVEILAGLEAGETVVAEGSFFLKSELVKGTFEAGHAH